MKYIVASLGLAMLLLVAINASAQNGAYSSYYTYTVTPNSDGSAYVTPTAEVTGIDDVSDWIEGSYRPVCTVRPKIQLNGDGDWIGGTRVALGRAVNQVRTGQAVYVPAGGSAVGVDFAVEADVSCSGPPNPNYWQYPSLLDLYTWSPDIDINFWRLAGFSPFQSSPPYHIKYCPSALNCPVGYGVASIINFVDFADLETYIMIGAYTKEVWIGGKLLGQCAVTSSCKNTSTPMCALGSIYVGDAACSPAWNSYFLTWRIGSGSAHCVNLFSNPTNDTGPEDCTPAE